jgi:hypothetical protein
VADEEVVLDENALAAGRAFCNVEDVKPSPDHSLVAWSMDLSGYETYHVYFKPAGAPTPLGTTLPGGGGGDAEAGSEKGAAPAAKAAPAPATASVTAIPDVLEGCDGNIEWGADNSVVYYLTLDVSHRPHKVWRHVMGTPQADDACLVTEDDEMYWMGEWGCIVGGWDSGCRIELRLSAVGLNSSLRALSAPAAPVGRRHAQDADGRLPRDRVRVQDDGGGARGAAEGDGRGRAAHGGAPPRKRAVRRGALARA